MTYFHAVLRVAAVAVLLLGGSSSAAAQYFGQNKVQYRTFDFQVLRTEHFDIHYYPEAEAAARDAARMAERWYARLSKFFDHELSSRQPLILYAAHPHFEQTNVVESMLGEGTGGVTESLKRRVTMPVGVGPAETDHVLGHELVHAFQYDILGRNLNQPLWFIEGMAEYLSLGSFDPHTAVWIRDAALREGLPTLRDLYNTRYFPYRYGHAFWAYVGGRWGDTAIAQILHASAGPAGGADPISIIEQMLGIDHEELSRQWHASIMSTMVAPLGERTIAPGRRVIEPGSEDELNVGPALSPDGSRIAFLSSRGRFSIDLYVADTATGRVLRRLTSTAADPHFDSLQFISSAGAWHPTDDLLAVGAVRRGRPVFALFDVDTGRREREIQIGEGIDEVFHPAWSPDGRHLAFAALSGGYSDLWVLDVEAGTVRRLTDDPYADLQPAWSPDGRRLVWLTDRFASSMETLEFGSYELAVMEVGGGTPRRLRTFEDTRHNSPQWSKDGSIYFIAYPDGVPDLYRVDENGGTPTRITRLMTGAVGITPLSPALAVAADGRRVSLVVYRNSTYEIFGLDGEQLRGVGGPAPTTVVAGQLAPDQRTGNLVDQLLANPGFGLPAEAAETASVVYSPRLSLDYVGQEFGITSNSRFGSYVGGGIALSFSDMLGNHVLSTVLQVNGGFEDFGGQLGYLNREHRWNWGGFFEWIPYVTGGVFGGVDRVNGQPVFVEQVVRDRQIDRRLMGVAQYPFNRAQRFEVGAAVRHLTFTRDIDRRGFSLTTGNLVFEDRQKFSLGDPVTLGEVTTAFVNDTSLFGATGPILGHRSRFELTPAWGNLNFTTLIADARHYVMPFEPLTIAGRVLHFGRYGSDADSNRLSPLFVGFQTLVRGYDAGTFDFSDCEITADNTCRSVDALVGSRLLVTGVELRAPLVGLFRGRLDYGPIPADLIAFFDAGVAWDRNSSPSGFGGNRPWARSVGAGVRVNAFGYLVMEFAGVRALDRVDDGWRFVFGITPGF